MACTGKYTNIHFLGQLHLQYLDDIIIIIIIIIIIYLCLLYSG